MITLSNLKRALKAAQGIEVTTMPKPKPYSKRSNMFYYEGVPYQKFEDAMLALMDDYPWAGDDKLTELSDLYIEEN